MVNWWDRQMDRWINTYKFFIDLDFTANSKDINSDTDGDADMDHYDSIFL